VLPEHLSQPSPDSVSHHGIADLPRHSNAKTMVLAVILQEVEDKGSRVKSFSMGVYAEKLASPAYSFLPGQTLRPVIHSPSTLNVLSHVVASKQAVPSGCSSAPETRVSSAGGDYSAETSVS